MKLRSYSYPLLKKIHIFALMVKILSIKFRYLSQRADKSSQQKKKNYETNKFATLFTYTRRARAADVYFANKTIRENQCL